MTTNPSQPRTRSLLGVHAWLIVIATAATIGSAAVYATTVPAHYVATAQVALGPEVAAGTALRPEMASERQIASSGTVTDRAASELGLDAREAAADLSVSVVVESSVLNIQYAAPTAAAASTGARTFAQSYVDYRNTISGASRIAKIVTWPNVAKRSGPNLPLILGLALVAGLSLGIGAAWTWDRVSDRVRDPAELTDRTRLPVLADLPRWTSRASGLSRGSRGEAFRYVAARISSAVSPRYRDLNIVVTSPRSRAGTTTVALNTALAFAAQDRAVVLVAADLHNVTRANVTQHAPGLLDVLGGTCTLESAVRQTLLPNLTVLPLGGSPATDHVSLPPETLRKVLGQLGSDAIVVVDAPPVLESAASLVLVDAADVVLLIGDLRSGKRGDVEQAGRLLEGFRPMVAGWVANKPRRGAALPIEATVEMKSVLGRSQPTAGTSRRAAS